MTAAPRAGEVCKNQGKQLTSLETSDEGSGLYEQKGVFV